jgi:hypothetical protein
MLSHAVRDAKGSGRQDSAGAAERGMAQVQLTLQDVRRGWLVRWSAGYLVIACTLCVTPHPGASSPSVFSSSYSSSSSFAFSFFFSSSSSSAASLSYSDYLSIHSASGTLSLLRGCGETPSSKWRRACCSFTRSSSTWPRSWRGPYTLNAVDPQLESACIKPDCIADCIAYCQAKRAQT